MLFADGLPSLTPLIAKSEGPSSPAPESDDVPEFGPDCLRGEIVEGFNLVLSEGGSIDDLDACAEGVGLSALYVLDDGVWVSYILGAPESGESLLPRVVHRCPSRRYAARRQEPLTPG